MAYEFHYTPTGTGVISGKEVLEQTEDAINDLGNTAISGVQEALDKAEQALTNSENAVDDAQTALNTANNAEGVAIQAQNDVSNLSGTVTNIGNRVTTAEGNITNLQGRMTTAEGNITNLQGRMTTAEGNIGNLQTDVSTAQATANSAQQTATTARQQSYVFRYSSTALVASSTNSNTLLDNTDNLKVGDKVIDSSGVLFSITAIDTANSTFTIGTALVDLAQDSDVVHLSGNETASGVKTFVNGITLNDWLYFTNNLVTKGTIPQSSVTPYRIYFGSGTNYRDSLFNIDTSVSSTGVQTLTFRSAENVVNGGDTRLRIIYDPTLTQPRCVKFQGDCLPSVNNTYECGNNNLKWKSVNGINPGALSLPDLSNGIDISSYLSVGASTNDSYTAPANGYIGVIFASSSACGCYVYNYTDGVFMRSNSITDSTYTNVCGCFIPIIKNQTLNISTRVTESIVSAKFYPCLGNV